MGGLLDNFKIRGVSPPYIECIICAPVHIQFIIHMPKQTDIHARTDTHTYTHSSVHALHTRKMDSFTCSPNYFCTHKQTQNG